MMVVPSKTTFDLACLFIKVTLAKNDDCTFDNFDGCTLMVVYLGCTLYQACLKYDGGCTLVVPLIKLCLTNNNDYP